MGCGCPQQETDDLKLASTALLNGHADNSPSIQAKVGVIGRAELLFQVHVTVGRYDGMHYKKGGRSPSPV